MIDLGDPLAYKLTHDVQTKLPYELVRKTWLSLRTEIWFIVHVVLKDSILVQVEEKLKDDIQLIDMIKGLTE